MVRARDSPSTRPGSCAPRTGCNVVLSDPDVSQCVCIWFAFTRSEATITVEQYAQLMGWSRSTETISATFTTHPAPDTRPITCPYTLNAPTSPTNNTPRTTASYTTPRGTTWSQFGHSGAVLLPTQERSAVACTCRRHRNAAPRVQRGSPEPRRAVEIAEDE